MSPQAAKKKIKAGRVVCSGAIFNYVTMADSGVINSGHEPNSVQCLRQCPFERRTLAEELKVKELDSDQPDGLIYCEVLFVKLFAVPVWPQPNLKKIHQPPLSNTQIRNDGGVESIL